MIGLSPLSAGHRRRFQPTCVRPSTGSYPRFSLPTDSSPGFASAARDSSRPVKARFRFGSLSVNLAPRQRLAGSFYKRHAVTTKSCSDCSWAHGFRYCFTPLPGCFSPFPHGTGALSVTGEYSGLEGGPPGFGPGFTCPALLRCRPAPGRGFAYGALTLCGRPSHAVPLPTPGRAGPRQGPHGRSYNPGGAKAAARVRSPVCPRPPFARRYSGDLGIDFFSSGYLDVSVPRVVLPRPMDSGGGWQARACRVRPFGDPRVEGCVPLTADYRSLPRPSSASCAKASAVRPTYLPARFPRGRRMKS